MSSSGLMDLMHCAMDSKIKARPGTTTTLLQEVAVPCGYYMFVLEDDKKLSLLKSHNFASAEVNVFTSKETREILKSNIDFHREHPFMREIHVPSIDEDSDGASDQITPIPIKFEITVNSFAHIKKVRLRAKLLTKANVMAQIINSNIIEKKRTRRRRSISSSSDSGSSMSSMSSMGSRTTPSSSFTDLPKPSNLRPDPSPLSPKMDDLELPSVEKQHVDKQHVDVVEKDVVVIQSSNITTITSEGVEQNNTTQITVEHSKTVTTESSTTVDSTSDKSKLTSSERGDGDSTSLSTSGVDPTEENLVYYKDITLKKKVVRKEQFPIQQKGRYYLVIETGEHKGPISRRFSCHLTLSQGETILKESHTNDAKRKITEDFTVDTDSATVTLELVNTNTTFAGTTDLQISLYMKNLPPEPAQTATHPHFRTGEVVWAVNACEVEKKHPQKLTAKITASGSYYIVVEKVDKIFGGLREISVNAMLTQPQQGEKQGRSELVASVVVGGVKRRPMKWKSTVFIAPAGSTIDFTVESFALVGSITYSMRLRKVPGLTAEEERIRKMVVMFMTCFGIYHFFYLLFSILNFIQNIGFTLRILFLSVDITLGRICLFLFIAWFKQNQDFLVPALKDVGETIRKISRKIKHFRDMSDGGKFDILRIFKQMSKEGKANDLRKWERQKLQTANE